MRILRLFVADMARIKRIAKDAQNIEVQGWIDEERLSNLIGRCISTIYIPRDEDYGISPVESMAAGKPVIGVREGGVLETVVHGETGLLVRSNPGEEDIVAAVREMDSLMAINMRDACENRAKLFSKEVFLEKMRAVVKGE